MVSLIARKTEYEEVSHDCFVLIELCVICIQEFSGESVQFFLFLFTGHLRESTVGSNEEA